MFPFVIRKQIVNLFFNSFVKRFNGQKKPPKRSQKKRRYNKDICFRRCKNSLSKQHADPYIINLSSEAKIHIKDPN